MIWELKWRRTIVQRIVFQIVFLSAHFQTSLALCFPLLPSHFVLRNVFKSLTCVSADVEMWGLMFAAWFLLGAHRLG